jgi:hypothetical protein
MHFYYKMCSSLLQVENQITSIDLKKLAKVLRDTAKKLSLEEHQEVCLFRYIIIGTNIIKYICP